MARRGATGSSCSPAPTPTRRSTAASRSSSCPMDQPGVEVRPIAQLTGSAEFCEVFFTDARTRSRTSSGEVNGGWAVAMTLLGHERGEEAATNPILFRAEFDRLVRLARDARARRRPRRPRPAGVVLHEGRDHALPRLPHPHAVPARRRARAPRRRSPSSTGASTTSTRSTSRCDHGRRRPGAERPPSVRALPHRRAGSGRTRPTRGSTCSC